MDDITKSALAAPCWDAEAVRDRRFRWKVQSAGDVFDAFVVVDARWDPALFGGRPHWRAAVSLHGRVGFVPVEQWTMVQKRKAYEILEQAIEGVGERGQKIYEGGVAIHAIRALTAREEKRMGR